VPNRTSDDITLIVPTYNRSNALRTNLGAMLEMPGISRVIIVNDGSVDDTLDACATFACARLQIITHRTNQGVARARNTGVAAAESKWVLFGEDDCRFPRDYAQVLLTEAIRYEADIVGAPWLHGRGTDETIGLIAASAPRTVNPSMDEVGVFPIRPVETPFMSALALVRRTVFQEVRYYEGFPVNGYREETDFFVRAARAGFRCLLTPATFGYQFDTWSGGQHHGSRLRYEYWVLRNNWHFLSRHGSWLVERHHIQGRLRNQMAFTWRRTSDLLRGTLATRLSRARATIGFSSRRSESHSDLPTVR
jgi:GT2 family glycosyltransferase